MGGTRVLKTQVPYFKSENPENHEEQIRKPKSRTINQKTQIRKPRRRIPTNPDLRNPRATAKVGGSKRRFDEFSLFDDVFLL